MTDEFLMLTVVAGGAVIRNLVDHVRPVEGSLDQLNCLVYSKMASNF